MLNTILYQVAACWILCIAVTLALGGLFMAIVFEVQCNRLEKKFKKPKVIPFSAEVNRLLDME